MANHSFPSILPRKDSKRVKEGFKTFLGRFLMQTAEAWGESGFLELDICLAGLSVDAETWLKVITERVPPKHAEVSKRDASAFLHLVQLSKITITFQTSAKASFSSICKLHFV
jgi:hypothetical protein